MLIHRGQFPLDVRSPYKRASANTYQQKQRFPMSSQSSRLRVCLSLLIFLCFPITSVNTQRLPPNGSQSQNFFEIQKRYNEQFEAKKRQRESPNERERDDEETKFRRFEMFWESRIDKAGSFAPYYENLLAFAPVPGCDCAGACNRTHWSFLGPDSMPTQNMGAITSVWVNPSNPQNILAGTYSAGLYRTTNGSAEWIRITQSGCKGECPGFPHGGVTSIAVDPRNKNVIYISLGINRGLTPEQYSYGVYKSTDGGNRWCPTDLQFIPTDIVGSTKVVMDPADSNTLFASAGNKVYKTTNAGATWRAKANVIYAAPNGHEIHDIAVSRNPGTTGLFISEAGDRCFQNTGCPTLSSTCPPSNSKWNCPLTDGKIWYDPDFMGIVMHDITVEALGFTPVPGCEVRFEKGLFSVTPNSVNILALSEKHACPLGQTADRIIARNINNNSPTLPSSWIQHLNPPGAEDSHGSGYASAFAVSPVNDSLVMIGSDHGNPGLTRPLHLEHGGHGFYAQ
jgi:photosystem II stability/assembly factor-like uncharacterized protein